MEFQININYQFTAESESEANEKAKKLCQRKFIS